MTGPEDALAYLATRMPATHATIRRAMKALLDCVAGLAPQTMLDLGAGPATAAIAATQQWPELQRIRLLEADPTIRELGARLLALAPVLALTHAEWIARDLSRLAEEEPADLVTACYVLSELTTDAAIATAADAWDRTRQALVIVEPGTKAGFGLIRQIRARLVELGAHVAAPCPHGGPCPMVEGDWCHFTERVGRSRLHREVKGGTAGYEDAPFSYIAVVRNAPTVASPRVLTAPRVTKGSVELVLCTRDGLERRTVPRRDRTAYQQVRRVRWGARLGPIQGDPPASHSPPNPSQ